VKYWFLDTSAFAKLHLVERGMNVVRDLVRSADLLRPGSTFLVIPATGCMELAADLVERHRLRGADSVQLAAALQARDFAVEADAFVFVSDDEAQCRAAVGEGLEVLRPAA
jgi:hypothetical protein